MLIRATVENFKSFDEKTELVMVSSSKIRKHPDHVVMIKGAKVLRHAAIYGANAFGKSNLIASLKFLQQVLKDGLPLSSGRQYCRNKAENASRESVFEVQFSLGDQAFAYGFSALLSQRTVTGEWLYELGTTSVCCLFERITTTSSAHHAEVTTSMKLTDEVRTRFNTYVEDFSDNDTSLFLTELNRSKKYAKDSPLFVFKRVYERLLNGIVIFAPMQPMPSSHFLFKEGVRDRISDIVSSFDTGVTDIEMVELTSGELADLVPRNVFQTLISESEKEFNSGNAIRVGYTYRSQDNLVVIEFASDGGYEAFCVRLRHGGNETFDFGEESEGTRRLFDLIYLLVEPASDVTFVVDELERSLHPMLVRHFLELFMEIGKDKRTQLLFSSHETTIMDQDLFRRDEIWFVDRGQDRCSHLYSLDRFKERYDLVVSKAYLEGRYGAVPFFSKYVHTNTDGA